MLIVARKNERITGSLNGNPFNIMFDEELFKDLKMVAAKLEQCESKDSYNGLVDNAKALLEVDFNQEVAAANGYLKYNKNKGTYHLVINKGKRNEKVSKDALPKVLADRIIESYETGSDYMPLLMAWRRFLTRDNMGDTDHELFARYLTATYTNQLAFEKYLEDGVSVEAATELATYNDIAITTYGILATYKVVDIVKKKYVLEKDADGSTVRKLVDAFPGKETIDEVTGDITKEEGKPKFLEELTFKPAIYTNGDKFFSKGVLGYKYKIGEEAVLPIDAKRNFNNTFGGGGLYAGGLNYIDGYSNAMNETLTCFIDPSEIISFQSDGAAIRVNRMFINGTNTIEGETEGMYFVSDYAKESDARIAERFAEVVKESADAVAELKEESDFVKGVIGDITE